MNGALDLDGTFTQDAGAVVFNEAGADYDFRVEGVGAANALFVDGANGNVGIGTAAIQSSRSTALEIVGGGSIASPSNADAGITLTNTGGGAGGTATTDLGYIEFYGKDEKRAYIGSRVESDKGVLLFGTDSSTDGSSLTERMRIDPDGNVGINDASPGVKLAVDSGRHSSGLGDTAGGFQIGDIQASGGRLIMGGNGDGHSFIQGSDGTSAYPICLQVSGGNVFIGDTANAGTTQGLTINQGANDDDILAFKSSDVAHGVTGRTETDTYGFIRKANAAAGGVFLCGITEGTVGMTLDATSTSDVTDKSTAADGNFLIRARKKSGSGDGQVGADANLVAIENYDTTLFLFDAEGQMHATVSSTTFDAYDDAQLVRAYDISHGKGMIESKFDQFIDYNHETLADLKLVGREEDGTPNRMVNVTGMQHLHNGAIWQQYTEMQKMKELMYDTMVEMLGKEKADAKLKDHDIKLLDNNNLLN